MQGGFEGDRTANGGPLPPGAAPFVPDRVTRMTRPAGRPTKDAITIETVPTSTLRRPKSNSSLTSKLARGASGSATPTTPADASTDPARVRFGNCDDDDDDDDDSPVVGPAKRRGGGAGGLRLNASAAPWVPPGLHGPLPEPETAEEYRAHQRQRKKAHPAPARVAVVAPAVVHPPGGVAARALDVEDGMPLAITPGARRAPVGTSSAQVVLDAGMPRPEASRGPSAISSSPGVASQHTHGDVALGFDDVFHPPSVRASLEQRVPSASSQAGSVSGHTVRSVGAPASLPGSAAQSPAKRAPVAALGRRGSGSGPAAATVAAAAALGLPADAPEAEAAAAAAVALPPVDEMAPIRTDAVLLSSPGSSARQTGEGLAGRVEAVAASAVATAAAARAEAAEADAKAAAALAAVQALREGAAGADDAAQDVEDAQDGPSPGRPPRAPPTRLGLEDFDILCVLGQGAFGKVFQVRRVDTGRVYAMKVMRKREVLRKDHADYITGERNILTTVHHRFIVTLRYSFQTPTKLYLVMDFVNGGHLFFQLHKMGVFEEDLARLFTAELVLALGKLHDLGIVHRDLKPENILLDSTGHIKLTDFGLAKTLQTGERSNSFIGTLEYMAPEVVTGRPHSKEVDWWSVGILLYEMLVGLPPFRAADRHKLKAQITHAKVNFPKFLTKHAVSLLRALLNRNAQHRLGAGEGGTAAVMAHPFFAGVDWARLEAGQVKSPFTPSLSNSHSVENFGHEWTTLPAVDSPDDTPVGSGEEHLDMEGAFRGFTYVHKGSYMSQNVAAAFKDSGY
ncbi:unnamed protein product [Pedinophyceae sp. YPF-701]|nr:unnamed protein product [Pedinophyceae sp. YPF-701]